MVFVCLACSTQIDPNKFEGFKFKVYDENVSVSGIIYSWDVNVEKDGACKLIRHNQRGKDRKKIENFEGRLTSPELQELTIITSNYEIWKALACDCSMAKAKPGNSYSEYSLKTGNSTRTRNHVTETSPSVQKLTAQMDNIIKRISGKEPHTWESPD